MANAHGIARSPEHAIESLDQAFNEGELEMIMDSTKRMPSLCLNPAKKLVEDPLFMTCMQKCFNLKRAAKKAAALKKVA